MVRWRLGLVVLLASCGTDQLPTTSHEPKRSIRDGGSSADSLALRGSTTTEIVAFSGPTPTTTSCSLSYDEGYLCGAPHPAVTPDFYHSGGIWEPVQTANIHVTFVGTIRAFQMRSTGALLCSGSLGAVTGYLNGVQVASVVTSLISPTDCGADDVTFGVQGAFPAGVTIDSVEVSGVSPWQFLVQGAPGRALLKYTFEYTQESGSLRVGCQPEPVVRTSDVTCTASVQGSGFSLDVTGWQFDASNGVDVVTRNVGVSASSWQGKLVTPGAVTVQANVNGAPATAVVLSSIAARTWSGIVALKDHQPIPTSFDERPPSEDFLGQTAHDLVVDPDESGYLGIVSDNGPNHGYRFFTGLPFFTRTRSQVNTLAINGTSPFYLIQEPKRKRINGLWFCPKSTVFSSGAPGVLFTLTEKHEGAVADPDIYVNSHPAIYRKHADTAAQARFESLVALGTSPAMEMQQKLQEIANGALFDSFAMHGDGRNYITPQALGNCSEFHFGPYP